jgi:hypothetical protein
MWVWLVLFALPVGPLYAQADGLGINLPVVGRLNGGGNVVFITAVDVANHSTAAVPIDFYLDGRDFGSGSRVTVRGSLDASGHPVARGAGGPVRARFVAHFDDIVAAMVEAGLVPATARDGGFLGSILFVFGGLNESGLAAVTARVYNRFGDGFVNVSLKGKEITSDEPQTLIAAIQDTRSIPGAAGNYPNLFLNNVGVTPDGTGTAGPVTVEVSAFANGTGQAVGVPIVISDLAPGQTVSVGSVLTALQINTSVENTILVVARVIAGTAAIHGVISQVDPVTRDGAAFEMSHGG